MKPAFASALVWCAAGLAFPPASLRAQVPTEPAAAAALAAMAPYHPQQKVTGTVRLWTRPARMFGPLVKAWQEGFNRYQPEVTFEFTLYGTASLVGGLYEGTADIAVLGEEIHPSAVAAFQRIRNYAPTTIEVATASLNVKFFGAANIFFVHRDNPLRQLSLAQLDGILGTEHRRGPGNIRTWGELGLTGDWAHRPIHPYTWLLAESFCLYLQNSVLGGSHEWNPAITEFNGGKRPDGSDIADGEQILEAVASDPDGIGVSSLTFLKPGQAVKALALQAEPNGAAYLATAGNLIERKYPLSRLIPAVIDRAPGQPIEPALKEFLRYLLSRDGQSDFVRTHGYLPLNPAAVEAQLKKLD